MKGKSNKIFSFLTLVISVLIISLVVGVSVNYFNGNFNNGLNKFYVNVNNTRIYSEQRGLTISSDKELKIYCKYLYSMNKNNDRLYSISIEPNINQGKDFDFNVDGSNYSFIQEKDLLKGFNIVYEKDYFTIKAKGNINDVLKAVHGGKDISDCIKHQYKDMFVIKVKSMNKKSEVKLYFSIKTDVTGIHLDKDIAYV